MSGRRSSAWTSGGRRWSLFGRRSFRWRFAAGVVAVLSGGGWLAAAIVEDTSALEGLVYDLTLPLAGRLAPEAGPRRVAIVALDRRSLESERLRALPRALMGPVFGEAIATLRAAGADQIGFDLVFGWSAGQLLPDHNQPLLHQLADAQGRVVLGRTEMTSLAPPFHFATGANRDPSAVGLIELPVDDDGISRRVRGVLEYDDGERLTLVGAMAQRLGTSADSVRGMLAPSQRLTAIPSYSLSDVLDCADQDQAALHAAFSGRAVLVGSSLPDEDLKRTPDRYLPPAPADGGEDDCLKSASGAQMRAGWAPGVYLHAEALDEVLQGRLVVPTSPAVREAVAAGLAAVGALLGLASAPWVALMAVAVLLVALLTAATALLGVSGVWLPFGIPAAALVSAASLTYGGRFMVERRRRQLIRQAFGHYLSPAVVADIAEREALPEIGGETLEISVMFADLSGFTDLSGRLPPDRLVALVNDYFDAIVAAVEEEGGYVDKFIGDAVMAVWGAPLADPDHAGRAVAAALRIADRVETVRWEAECAGEPAFRIKIAINSGPAVAGNIGSARRLNYTVVGSTVNLAARLEAVPGRFDCAVALGPATAQAVADRFIVYELDSLHFKGLELPVAVHEPLGLRTAAAPEVHAYVEVYARALAAWRAGDVAAATRLWQRAVYPLPFGAAGGPPRAMGRQAREWILRSGNE